MERTFRILDLCCGAGGAGVGYQRAGFEVTGVDIAPQTNCPYETYIEDVLKWDDWDYDAIHFSPPCQRWTTMNATTTASSHPDLYTPMLPVLDATGLPYVIENVPTSPLKPSLVLCGTMFDLVTKDSTKELRRHRVFETNWRIKSPARSCNHTRPPVWAAGHSPNQEYRDLYGQCPMHERQEAWGIDWMTRDELMESIPPAFTEFIGLQLIEHLRRKLETS